MRSVSLSKTAEKKLNALFDFLLENWSEEVKSTFIKKLDSSIRIIREKPEIFPKSKVANGLRKCVITKQTTLFYRFNSSKIDVVSIFDTRQNPKKISKEI